MGADVAVITGGGRGIGLEIGQRLARDGYAISVLDLDDNRARTAAVAFSSTAARALGLACDVTDPESLERALEETRAQLGLPTVLVNCAVRYVWPPVPAEQLDYTLWRECLDVNLNAAFLASQRVARPLIKARAPGAIVNIASVYSSRALDPALYASSGVPERFDELTYQVAKGALVQLTRGLAAAWGPLGIRVNAVSPGMIATESSTESFAPEVLERLRARTPLRRLGEAAEVAAAVAYLVSADAAFTNGADLVVDGGWTCL